MAAGGPGRRPWQPAPVHPAVTPTRLAEPSPPAPAFHFSIITMSEEPAEVTGCFTGGAGPSVTIKPQLVAWWVTLMNPETSEATRCPIGAGRHQRVTWELKDVFSQ